MRLSPQRSINAWPAPAHEFELERELPITGLKTAQRGYGGRWQRARLVFLADHPFCVMCEKAGLLNVGTLHMDGTPELNRRRIGLRVDHILPHRGDQALFWDKSNWQPLCADHHDIVKQRQEQQGASIKGAVGLDGRPRDASHPWNRSV